jgi:hypothetical protein
MLRTTTVAKHIEIADSSAAPAIACGRKSRTSIAILPPLPPGWRVPQQVPSQRQIAQGFGPTKGCLTMAKGQKRSSREPKKPKGTKKPVGQPTTTLRDQIQSTGSPPTRVGK